MKLHRPGRIETALHPASPFFRLHGPFTVRAVVSDLITCSLPVGQGCAFFAVIRQAMWLAGAGVPQAIHSCGRCLILCVLGDPLAMPHGSASIILSFALNT